MAFSVGGLSAYSNISYIKPMNYAVENDSQVSDAYTQAVGQSRGTETFPSVNPSGPVQYANSYRVNPAAQVEASQKVGQQYNAIAAEFSGIATGYQSDSTSYSYQMIGSNFDMYA